MSSSSSTNTSKAFSNPSTSGFGYNTRPSNSSGTGSSKSGSSKTSTTKSSPTKNLGFGSAPEKYSDGTMSASAAEKIAQDHFFNSQLPTLHSDTRINRALTSGLSNGMWSLRQADASRQAVGQKPLGDFGERSVQVPGIDGGSGFRTMAQAADNAKRGTGVTGNHSFHTVGLASDVVVHRQPGESDTAYNNRNEKANKALNDAIDPTSGITWGDRWGDPAHFQLGVGSQRKAAIAMYGLPGAPNLTQPRANPAAGIHDPNQGRPVAASAPVLNNVGKRVAVGPESGLAGRLGQILGLTLPPEAPRIGFTPQGGPAPLLNDATFKPPKMTDAQSVRKRVAIGGPAGTINGFTSFPDVGTIGADPQNGMPPMTSDSTFHIQPPTAPAKRTGLLGAIDHLINPPSASQVPSTDAPPAPPDYGGGLIGLGNRLRGTPMTDSRHIPGIGEMFHRIFTHPPTQDPNADLGTPMPDGMAPNSNFPGNSHNQMPSDGFAPPPVPSKAPMTFDQLIAMLSQGNLNGIT